MWAVALFWCEMCGVAPPRRWFAFGTKGEAYEAVVLVFVVFGYSGTCPWTEYVMLRCFLMNDFSSLVSCGRMLLLRFAWWDLALLQAASPGGFGGGGGGGGVGGLSCKCGEPAMFRIRELAGYGGPGNAKGQTMLSMLSMLSMVRQQ